MEIVKIIIDEWDPIDLLSHAPSDEYCFEIERIYQLLQLTDDINSIAEGIYNIFVESFGDDIFIKNMAECEQIAYKLLIEK